jgi:hypothetical protein
VTLNAYGNVSSIVKEYDVTNYEIYNNQWDKANAIENSSIGRTTVNLSSLNTSIITGTILRVIFYYAKVSDYEDVFFSKNGVAITNKRFGHISSINKLSGFQDSSGNIRGSILIDAFNQPLINSTYSTDYNYTAPKENERITVNYEYNKLITDSSEAIEDERTITADVLIKEASKIEVDVTAYIVVSEEYENKEESVSQDVSNQISDSLNSESLGTTIDKSDVSGDISNVEGVDRVRITLFNTTGNTGIKESISANGNEYIAPGTINVETEDR